ncbi:ATP-binding protein [Membranihabitans marinus]|uniref:ATP-binding protein n=1 Tax=Membranihabitans marinus TaxID=1227546 RepID=UPI001F1A89D4|nr:AAA family ATPase [Membranihabitans marinus]
MTDTKNILKQRLEDKYQDELNALIKTDSGWKPDNWKMSPQSVLQFILGNVEVNGVTISPKYIGHKNLVETAIATLATQRALLLTGMPGTAKTWLAEHLAVAISGNTKHLIQGSSATTEEDILFGWNYASLIAKGPHQEALVESAIYKSMQGGEICRIEELSRIPAMIQDNLLSLLSEKLIVVPELDNEIRAHKGFNIIATSNDKDKGTFPLSDALKRRFNVIQMPFPSSLEEEVNIVRYKLDVETLPLSVEIPVKEIERVVQIFRELRSGVTEDSHQKINTTQSNLSTAEAISTLEHCIYMAGFFGEGRVTANEIAATLPGAILKDIEKDSKPWEEYKKLVIAKRPDWQDLKNLL